MPTALLSVYDKKGLVEFARTLAGLGWKFLASGGTSKALKEAGFEVEEISAYTGVPEILGGRVKTLHPAVHGGILARADERDLREIESLGYRPIDLVVVDLYPFVKAAADPSSTREGIVEKIDIGGVALIRAAAKNHGRVAIICDQTDYGAVGEELARAGSISEGTRKRLAAKAFGMTAAYDAAIASWLESDLGDASAFTKFTLKGFKALDLRYGENPHQKAQLYSFEERAGPLGGKILQGKELSYNNILDLDAAWYAVGRFEGPAVVLVKHLSPCGIAAVNRRAEASGRGGSGIQTLSEALSAAIACDQVSAYGSVIACNAPFDVPCVKALGKLFVECIAAPAFADEALALLSARKNLRLVIPGTGIKTSEVRTVLGGFLLQDVDLGDPAGIDWKVVSRRQPTAAELEDLAFAWKACMSVKSNAIVLAKGGATVGIGGGQPNRVDSVRIAASRAGEKAKDSVLASDAFFPFPDSIGEAAKAGVTAIAHPGGSIRDGDSLKAADEAGMAMVLTGVRHFRH
ncbi:MAG: bifunctional phosphoribosylaminoimidazolecarboxamide formyltransferase/IMP cyclohydrolase [Spirochaetes bacterium]|nr:bifunctional phosphoribosylaminoimidazolecarboxamide formyltransferase/IMP cyclohydrolase [Spirochaetota bacterium]